MIKHTNWKQNFLFEDDKIVYVENLKNPPPKKRLLDLMSGYKVNIQMPAVFLYLSTENSQIRFLGSSIKYHRTSELVRDKSDKSCMLNLVRCIC